MAQAINAATRLTTVGCEGNLLLSGRSAGLSIKTRASATAWRESRQPRLELGLYEFGNQSVRHCVIVIFLRQKGLDVDGVAIYDLKCRYWRVAQKAGTFDKIIVS